MTHNHFDHTRGVDPFLKRNPEAALICNEQVAKSFKKWSDQIVLVEPGEEIQHKTWKLKFIKGRHGLFSSVKNTGVIVRTSTISFGHAGDSVDFSGVSQEKLDYFAIPICGIFAASPKKALKELERFKQPLPTIIPMHWIWRNPHGFCHQFSTVFPEGQCVVPKNGNTVPI